MSGHKERLLSDDEAASCGDGVCSLEQGRAEEGPEAEDSTAAFEELLGPALVDRNGPVSTAEALRGCEVVLFYFSGSWCPPCHVFTPKLVATYNKLKAEGKRFEVVFISSDKDEDAFRQYYTSMPWLALDYRHRRHKADLSKRFGVVGIPTLIILNPRGATVSAAGRTYIERDPEGTQFPWTDTAAVRRAGARARSGAGSGGGVHGQRSLEQGRDGQAASGKACCVVQ